MNMFTPEEISLICIYNPGNRAGTIAELRDMMRYLMPDELELKQLTQGVIKKLEKMSDSAFDALSDELIRMTIAKTLPAGAFAPIRMTKSTGIPNRNDGRKTNADKATGLCGSSRGYGPKNYQ